MEKLLAHPCLVSGESLAGYVLRLAEINGYKSPKVVLSIAGEERPEALNILSVDKLLLARVAPVVGRSTAELEPGLYRLEATLTLPKFAMWGALMMPLSALRKDFLPICPECLKEEPFIRQAWDWLTVTSCSVHQKLLVDVCESCGERLTRFRPGVSKCSCGFDLRESSVLSPELYPSVHHKDLSAGPLCEYGHYARLTTVVVMAALLADAGSLLPRVNKFANASVLTQHQTLRVASNIWRRGGLTEFLQQFLNIRSGLFPEFGPRMALLPIHRERHDLLALSSRTLQEAAALTEFRIAKIDTKESQNVPAMNANDVGFVLNLAPRLISISKKFGAISHPDTVESNASYHKVFAAEEVLALLTTLKPSIADESPVYCFKDLSHPKGVPGIVGSARLLGALRGGTVRVIYFDPIQGVPSVKFQLFGSVDCNIIKKAPAYISVKDAAEQLGIYRAAVYRLISANLLDANKIGRVYQLSSLVVQKFSRKFVFTREIAIRLGFNPKHLAEKLMAVGCKAYSGPRVDGALIYVFRRSDTDGIDVERLKSLAFYHTYGGRKPRGGIQYAEPVLRCSEVAQRLNISVIAVTRLAKGGWLRCEDGPEIFNKTIRFMESEITRYENEYRNNLGLLTLAQAATAMGVSELYIRCRWVGTPYIPHLSDGLVSYIRESDFRKIISDRYENLTYGDLIVESGVKRPTLQHWIKIGLLRPIVSGQYSVRNFSLFSRQTLLDLKALAAAKISESGS